MGPSTVISVQGAFDAGAASAVCKRLAEMDSGESVVIDFTEARELNVVALTVLMNGTGEIRQRVSLWGLSQHYQRVLRYLGFRGTRVPPESLETIRTKADGRR